MLATQVWNPRYTSRFGALQDVPPYSELKAGFTASSFALGDNSFWTAGEFVHLLFGSTMLADCFAKGGKTPIDTRCPRMYRACIETRTKDLIMKTFRVTHNYLGHHLGFVEAPDAHAAIVTFSTRTGMSLAALVATPHQA